MRILRLPASFIWDEGNLVKNLKKHKVTVQEAEELFTNEPFTAILDDKHSTKAEKRYQALGKTKNNRKLFTAFTVRDNKIRVISVRDMNRKEKSAYEKLETNS
ncbi:MAG: BrnT family toxin [Candidatus Saccharimonadales bacterium]